MDEKIAKQVFDVSEKAEFMEEIKTLLPNSYRVLVMFEERNDSEDSVFEYRQLGFSQTYEVLGFLEWIKETAVQVYDAPEFM